MEPLMEKAAPEMRLDPVEIRRRNFIRPENFPYRTHLGDVYDSGNFPRIIDRLVELADWQGFAARREQSRSRGRLRGRGLSVYLEWTGALPTETVDIRVGADGTVTAFSGTQAMGQGLETTYTQLLAEVLGINWVYRSEEHTSELQSRSDLVCRLLLEKKKDTQRHSSECST